MKLPTFLIFGVQKAGTTSIYSYLKEHPQIYMSPLKETNFLSKDSDNLSPEEWENHQFSSEKRAKIRNFEQYCQLFTEADGEIAIGEASPNYLFHYETSIKNIRRFLPDVQLIAILRDPAERAYSDYLMHIRDNIPLKSKSFGTLIESHPQSFIFRKGFYYTPLKQFFDAFSSDKIKIYLYDDLCEDALGLMQDMFEFVGVDRQFCPNVLRKEQVAEIPKSRVVNQILVEKNPLRTTVSLILKSFLPVESRQRLRRRFIEWNSHSKSQSPLLIKYRQKLIDMYHDDLLKLEDLIQRDLSGWLTI
ncbi:MAG: sulfotransferase [Chloroflexaceae bacterium]|nr:sulfotransferase [Chloroflexaceae bacterium]